MNCGSFDAREYQLKNTRIKEINIKVHEGFNVVWPIMSTSTDERESFHYS